MNGRSNRYRLHHWQLAERQRYLKELESLSERLRADIERLGEEIGDAGGDTASLQSRIDPLFVRPLLDRRDKMQRSIDEIDAQIAEARAALAGAQQEMKLVEATLAPAGFKFEERMTRRARRSV